MIVTLAKRMLSKSFSKVKFKFTRLDWDELSSFDFGPSVPSIKLGTMKNSKRNTSKAFKKKIA